jgi:hypothetical protein
LAQVVAGVAQRLRSQIRLPPLPVLGVNHIASQPGAAVVRESACWECVEPQPGVFNWAPDDALAAELGPRWLPILGYAPGWAGGGMSPSPWKGVLFHLPPTNLSAWATFAAAFVARYRPATVEIWNEPDIPTFFSVAHPQYVYRTLYLAAYAAIKRVDPYTHVLISGIDEEDGPWFLPALRGLPTDGISVHPYASTPDGIAALLHEDEALLRAYGFDEPIYVTEIGYSGFYEYCTPPSRFPAIVRAIGRDPEVKQIDAYFC